MKKVVRIYPVILIGTLFFLSFTTVFGQDLGSSNGLFRASNPKSKNASAEKKATSVKTAPAKKPVKKILPQRTVRESVKTTNSTNKNQTQIAKKPSKKSNPRQNNVITAGKKTTADLSELYEEAIDEGNIARDARNYTIAETAYREANKLNPEDSRAVYGLGNIYSDQQRWEESEQFYRKAIALKPENPDSYIALSFVLTQPILGKELSSRFIEAEKCARQAIELDPQNPFAYDQLGVALELNGKIGSETRAAYLKAISIEPEFALAYAHLGRLLRRNGKVNESTDAYSKAIAFSNDIPTMILVADVLQSQQRYSESEQLLRRALREDPKNPSALFLLGRALTIGGQYDEAESVLKKSVEVSPNSFVSYVLLGSVYTRRGDFAVAEKTLNNALEVISENERKNLAQAFETLGDGYFKFGKKTEAMRVYRQAVSLDNQKESLTQKLTRAQL